MIWVISDGHSTWIDFGRVQGARLRFESEVKVFRSTGDAGRGRVYGCIGA